MAVSALLVAALAFETAKSQQGDDGKTKRVAYVVKYGSAKDLAATLGKYFKGDVDVQVTGDPANNLLLLSANPKVFDEVLATLAKLDRRPQLITVEIYVVDVPAKKAGDKEFDEKTLSGSLKDVAASLKALQKSGMLGSVRQFTLTAVENQSSTLMNGETKPYVGGVTKTGIGNTQFTIMYRNVGTQVVVTPRVGDKTVTLELKMDDSRMVQPEEGIPLGIDDKGRQVMATEFVTAKLNAAVSVTVGQAVLAEGVQTTAKAGTGRTLVVVAVRAAQ